jgi:hypothetical protein
MSNNSESERAEHGEVKLREANSYTLISSHQSVTMQHPTHPTFGVSVPWADLGAVPGARWRSVQD